MKTWFIKTFRKRQAVRLVIILEDHRVIEFWRIPQGDTVQLQGYGAYKIDSQNLHLTSKNVPTYYYNILNTEPLKMIAKETKTYMSPDKYQTALNSKAEKALLDATKPVSIDTQTVILIVVFVVGLLGLGYYLSGQIQAILDILTPEV